MKKMGLFFLSILIGVFLTYNPVNAKFAGGDGTTNDPWQVGSADQLHSVRDHLGAHFILISDIDLDVAPYNEDEGWEPVGVYIEFNDPGNAPFTGTFSGNGYTISNLYINRPGEDFQGLFRDVRGALITNVTLSNIDITGFNFTGGLVGQNVQGIISNAVVSGVIVANGGSGGMVGIHSQQGALITDSHAFVDVTGVSGLGGLVGTAHSNSYISQSSANGTITGTGDGFGNIGGLAGTIGLESGISDSHASGDVTSAGARVGGLVGAFTAGRISDFINCYATGKVSGVSFVGGLVGYLSNSKIADSFATGDVEGESFIGGLVGDNDDGEIVYHPITHWRHETYASGNVTGTGTLGRVGGLVGSNRGSIVRAYATGVVVGTDQVGGLAGLNSSFGVIDNSYATGSIKGNNQVGGLVGNNVETNQRSGKIINSYAVGKVDDAAVVGGLVGVNGGDPDENVISSYFNIETTEQSESDGGYGFTTEDMTYPYADGVYENWDFENVWIHDTDHSRNNGYPHMKRDQTETYAPNPYIEREITHEITLSQNYPNPFNPATHIEFFLPEASQVRLEIYDMLGRRVALLVNEHRQAGRHQVRFDASGMASGIYVSRLQAGNVVHTKQMTFIK